MEKLFINSAIDSALLKLIGASAFIPIDKLWLYDKLSTYNYELCLTKYSTVVRLFIDKRWLKKARNRRFRPTLRCWRLCFHSKAKIASFQSKSSDIVKDHIMTSSGGIEILDTTSYPKKKICAKYDTLFTK